MSDLTDLEICKRVAEIEGLESRQCGNVECAENHYVTGSTGDGTKYYNPLADDALCFRLMIKYDMAPFKCEFGGYECVYDISLVLSGAGIVNDESPNRAICLSIIECNGGEV